MTEQYGEGNFWYIPFGIYNAGYNPAPHPSRHQFAPSRDSYAFLGNECCKLCRQINCGGDALHTSSANHTTGRGKNGAAMMILTLLQGARKRTFSASRPITALWLILRKMTFSALLICASRARVSAQPPTYLSTLLFYSNHPATGTGEDSLPTLVSGVGRRRLIYEIDAQLGEIYNVPLRRHCLSADLS